MSKKTTEKNNILTIGELAEVSGIRLTTLKYYTELGILPFNQAEKERLGKIKELKEKRLTIKEIIDHFNKSN